MLYEQLPCKNAENIERVCNGETSFPGSQIVPIDDCENCGKESNAVAKVLNPRTQPSIGDEIQIKRSVVGLNEKLRPPQKPLLLSVGSNGRDSADRFSEMRKNWRLADRVKTFQLTRRRNEDPLDQQIEAGQREDDDQEVGSR